MTLAEKDTSLLLALALLSFGGATGRFSFGLSLFDILLVFMLIWSLFRVKSDLVHINKIDFTIVLILLSIICFGFFRAKLGVSGVSYDYIITE